MKKHTLFLLAVLSLFCFSSCQKKITFSGEVTDADSVMLYLQYDNMSAYQTIDSVMLCSGKPFSFKVARVQYPEFYRLLLGEKSLVLALDSLSNDIAIKAQLSTFEDAEIVGSQASSDIQALRQSALALQLVARTASVDVFSRAYYDHKLIAQHIILADTHSPAAYYAVYQRVNDVYLFNPLNTDDLPYWTAVATGFDVYCPASPRTAYLKDVVLSAQKQLRAVPLTDMSIDAMPAIGAPELNLPNRSGDKVALSSLRGEVVLLDFSSYAMKTAPAHNLFLRELYDSYHSAGFQIYQVSVDEDRLLWMEKSRPMPWIAVRDDFSSNPISTATYNVTELPSFFLINREGDVVGRYNHENVKAAIAELL